MAFFALAYEYGPDYLEKRGPHTEGHMGHLKAAEARGEVVFAGAAMEAGVPFGFVVFQVDDIARVENYAKTDPYVVGGVTKSWKARPWYGLVGPGAP